MRNTLVVLYYSLMIAVVHGLPPPTAYQHLAATGTLTTSLMTTGWDILNVTTNSTFPDDTQAYSAGFVEGVLTAEKICIFWNNFGSPMPKQLLDFLDNNYKWAVDEIIKYNTTSTFWYQVGLVYRQWEGLYDGMASTGKCKNVTRSLLYTIASMGDAMDILNALNITKSKLFRGLGPNHCSALIKVAADLSDVFFGHVTWATYNMMTRMYKHYRLHYNKATTSSKLVSFSSYPGAITSVDDFHITDTGLVAMETSLNVYNFSIYQGNVVPQSLLYWVRVAVANRMATDGKDWASIFQQYNSGTYVNQWMILDLSRFTPGKDLSNDTLWLVEQIPGRVVAADVTNVLGYGYWPSYNVPYFPDVYNALGYQTAGDPSMNSYEHCARADIFRRDQTKVVDIATMRDLMEYNNFLSDPFSDRNPTHAISARGDLDVTSPQCFGGIDSKIGSFTLFSQGLGASARSGPTMQQGVFSFKNQTSKNAQCSVVTGMPQEYAFNPVQMAP